MRLRLLSLLAWCMFTPSVWAACPSRSFTYTTGNTIDAGQVTTNEDNLYTYACAVDTFAASSVNAAAIADDAVGASEISAGAVGASEIASGAVDAGDMATTGTITDDKAFIADSATAGTWRTVPNCTDASGNHLNYTQSTNSLSCGTSSSSTGDVTDVGPGCATGACFTDGVTTTGTNLLIWEGTTDNVSEYNVVVPADPASDVTLTLPTTSVRLGDYSARAFNSATFSCPDNTSTVITLNSERWDTDTMHSTVTSTGRLTAITAGKYLFTCHMQYGGNATGRRVAVLQLNGATVVARNATTNIGATNVVDLTVATHYNMAANDYMECLCLQNSGAALDVLSEGNNSIEFTAARTDS